MHNTNFPLSSGIKTVSIIFQGLRGKVVGTTPPFKNAADKNNVCRFRNATNNNNNHYATKQNLVINDTTKTSDNITQTEKCSSPILT